MAVKTISADASLEEKEAFIMGAQAERMSRDTPAGHDLIDFMNSCKAQGLRTAKGEFVASDGTRMLYDWTFERSEKKGAREDG